MAFEVIDMSPFTCEKCSDVGYGVTTVMLAGNRVTYCASCRKEASIARLVPGIIKHLMLEANHRSVSLSIDMTVDDLVLAIVESMWGKAHD
jgi:hypothetical protein